MKTLSNNVNIDVKLAQKLAIRKAERMKENKLNIEAHAGQAMLNKKNIALTN
jgi:hypothetical protein